ncbi:glutamate receptor 3.7-like [Macadamia integrifolia]|uniref:glutamate receptor 3.7-like n=1 Tax=Macadamia integrifolia TaxID=60698 RepID=UPI001C4E77C2|nr:glutamate receptor 3.7-like [Macadamia integrifolia]
MASVVHTSFLIFICIILNGFVHCQRPPVVNVGVVFTFDSVIGRAAKGAMEAAAADINKDSSILNGTQLNLIMADAKCSVFMGSIGVFQVIEKGVVAIIGPQSSGIAHMISSIANGLQVPLISFAATDPTLSALQFPFFIRSTQSDYSQMAAMADLIYYYGWKRVIAVYVDDDYGRNGISALDDALAEKMSKISYKVAFPPGAKPGQIADLLNNSKLVGPRVYVVHVSPDSGLTIFSIAQQLQMMTSDYVWFATDWLSTKLDSLSYVNQALLLPLQGVVGLRQHIPQSSLQKAFVSHWRELYRKSLVSSGLNAYGLYAYDAVWAVARSIDAFLNEDRDITFSFNKNLHDMNTSLQLEKLKTFDGGTDLLNKLLWTNFTGLTGAVQFDADRNLIGGGYEIINVDKAALRRIGYWSNYSGLSVVVPETLEQGQHSYSQLDQKLSNVTWPGQKTENPRGWVIADNERPLRIGVPKRISFVEFVAENNHSNKIEGYCIDVFNAARELIPYDIPYKYLAFGNGQSNPNYNELVRMVAEDVFDGVIGDIAIVTNRTKIVDFTQPYVATGLVIVAPISNNKSSAWVFLRPFTVEMWCTTAAFFVLIGVVIWILEHRVNKDFRGPPSRQLITMFLFSFATLFKTNQEYTMSTLGRIVMMIWLFVLMVITSSYTASLTSFLTIQQLSSPITGIDGLIASRLPIGYQVGSFAESYLKDSLNIPSSRLVSLGTPEEYGRALQHGPSNGGVAAIVDELPYLELFLSKQAGFGIIGQMFTKNGWGFAFQRGSPLAVDMSTAILRLSESGKLQEIHDKWFCKLGCARQGTHQSDPNQLQLISFWGLYLLCGAFSLTAFLVFIIQMVWQFVRSKQKQRDLSSHASEPSNARCSQVIYSFFLFIDEKVCDNPEPPRQVH